MKYRLKQGLEPRSFTMGRKTYILDSVTYREYPDNLISFFLAWLDTEPQPKPKKEKTTEIEFIEEVNHE